MIAQWIIFGYDMHTNTDVIYAFFNSDKKLAEVKLHDFIKNNPDKFITVNQTKHIDMIDFKDSFKPDYKSIKLAKVVDYNVRVDVSDIEIIDS